MVKVSATASLGAKLNLQNKKDWGQYDNVNSNHSMTIERHYEDTLTDDELVDKGAGLHGKCRKFVEARVAEDFRDARKVE